ncbi:conserved hypothetical protein [Coccidioides posadasii str. Silveira]|uniref:Uncharacterized protein n=1 Tax=Coccidioides posadasii (strain RMSCC 757 / Silveira) TaxID=443226 RepID=E9D223_COCPS|nr:conserved hypothetical protein [Coccidioides posadasii str. Silveira]
MLDWVHLSNLQAPFQLSLVVQACLFVLFGNGSRTTCFPPISPTPETPIQAIAGPASPPTPIMFKPSTTCAMSQMCFKSTSELQHEHEDESEPELGLSIAESLHAFHFNQALQDIEAVAFTAISLSVHEASTEPSLKTDERSTSTINHDSSPMCESCDTKSSPLPAAANSMKSMLLMSDIPMLVSVVASD